MKKNSNKKKPEVPKLLLPKGIEIYHPRNPTSLDKIRGHYLKKKKLSSKLEYLKTVYEFTNSLLLEGYSRQQVVNFLQQSLPKVSQGHAYEIVRNTIELFGDIHKNTKEGLRYLVIDNQWQVYRRAVEAGDIKEQNQALKNIGLFGNLGKGSEIDWTKIILPVPVFSTDAEVLKQQQLPETFELDPEDEEGLS